MKKIGVIWGDELTGGQKPFDKEYQNKDYRVYSDLAGEKNVKLFYGHYSNYQDGKFAKAFLWNGDKWVIEEEVLLDGAFDKFPYNDETEEIKKELNKELPVINDFQLEKFCKDKLESAEKLSEYFPETRTHDSLEEMLQRHGKVVVKPRYGHGGEEVHIVESVSELEISEDIEYIVQKFVEASQVPIEGVSGEQHDIRIVFVNNEAVYSYVRTPEDEESASNVAKDGSITYVDLLDVPEEIRACAEQVSMELKGYRPCLFSVDLIVSSDGKPYVLELNSKPGMYFSDSEGREEYERPAVESLIKALSQL